MGLLLDRYREIMGADKDPKMQEASFDVMYPTGFFPFDFLNGYKVLVKTPNGDEYTYNSIGVVDGSSTVIIGRAGCGKTSFAVQAGANIIRPFENAVMYIDDIEGGSNRARMYKLSGFDPVEAEKRIIYRNSAISAENFYERIYKIYEDKITHKDDYEYDTGLLDFNGKRVYKLIPTVYVLDSLAMLMPDKITEEEELTGQMSATASAKTNTAALKRIIPKLKAANIILFVVNHINAKVDINPFAKTKAQVNGLKPDETLPGGNANNYLANNLIRLDDSTKLKDSEGLGINGKYVDFTIIKSRTNQPYRSVTMVLDFDRGYDPILSLFTFMKSNGYIASKGAYMTVDGSDIKFTQKGFVEKLFSDEAFSEQFNGSCMKHLDELLAPPYRPDQDQRTISQNNLLNNFIRSSTQMTKL